MTDWPRPAGTAGDMSLIRTNLGAARADPHDCPLARGAKARPLLHPEPSSPWPEKPLENFTLRVLMDALDMIECDRLPAELVTERIWLTRGTLGRYGPPAHPGLLAWTITVIPLYLAAREADQRSRRLAGAPLTLPVRDEWVVQDKLSQPDARGGLIYEQTAWGRRYAALDGSARDLWLLSFGAAKEDRPDPEKAAAAYNAACGRPCTGGRGAQYDPVQDGELHAGRMAFPGHVRVIEFGCGDGAFRQLLELDQQEAGQKYAADARLVLARVVDDSRAVPGSSCADCKVLAGCTTLVRGMDLLPLAPPARHTGRRSISASDLRAYKDCPAKYHLMRQLKLPDLRPERPEITRGRAVDAWLNDRHLARPEGGCRALPGPADPSSWSAGKWRLSGQEAEDGAGMIAQHAFVCPLEGIEDHERVLVQHQLACYDPSLDLVIIAVPDLLHTRGGGWVWRETKTASSRLWEGEPLLRRYPQLAVGVVMLAAGVLGGDLARSRVELELLHADDLAFEELDPSRPRVVTEAREVLAEFARPWIEDYSFRAAPTKRSCHDCEALDWCQPGRDFLTADSVPAEER